MRFGGHETFAIREGWLHKGLSVLMQDGELLNHEHAADWLGVGRNMAKSIRHWLLATGLADPIGSASARKIIHLQPTGLAKLVWNRDRYFAEPGTWWALHINLVHSPQYAATWSWFFNSFALPRFERSVCQESLTRFLQASSPRLPSATTLQRDVACLLASYSRPLPPENGDPEEAMDCPFIELGLINHHRTSGYYQVQQGAKDIPLEIFAYCMSMAFKEARGSEGSTDITIQDATRAPGAPGHVLALTSESLFETVLRLENAVPRSGIQIAGLAGERVIRIRRSSPIAWLSQYYQAIQEKDQNVA